MVRNVKHAGKPDGDNAIVPQKPGPTFTKNDPAKFGGPGKSSGKTPSNGVVTEGKGPTITCNETLIPTPNADKPAKMSKMISDRATHDFKPTETAADKTATKSGSGSPTDRPYPLATRYDKHGATESKAARKVL